MANSGVIYKVMKKLNDIFYMQHGATTHYQKHWNITQLLSPKKYQKKYAVVVLNRPITLNQDYLYVLWNLATVRITVDGGTEQWENYLSTLSEEMRRNMRRPNLVTGDFDSISKQLLEKYKRLESKIVETTNQKYTDFTKALIELNLYCRDKEIELDYVIALGQSSGRMDHILGNIQTLFLNKDHHILRPNTDLYIISDDALSWLLYPGEHAITIPLETRAHKKAWCSLVPVGETCYKVSSKGLKWNLDNTTLKFGDLISTSNAFSGSEIVLVRCSHTLLWSMEIPSLTNAV